MEPASRFISEPQAFVLHDNAIGRIKETYIQDVIEKYKSVRKVLVTFASGQSYEESQKEFCASALKNNRFWFVEANNPCTLDAEFRARNAELLSMPKGAGYWIWKPYLIHRAMLRMSENDFIMYADTSPKTGLTLDVAVEPVIDWLFEEPRRVGSLLLRGFTHSHWTKRDCFHFMSCDQPDFWNKPQIQTSPFAMLVNAESRELVREWMQFAADRRVLTDEENKCGLPNLDGFREHRHDQSVLTNCIYKHGFQPYDFSPEPLSKNVNKIMDSIATQRALTRRPGCNIAVEGYCTQSSLSPHSRPDDPMRVVRGPVDGGYKFHTLIEANPSWRIDLLQTADVSQIRIYNRRNECRERAKTLQVLSSTNGQQWILLFDAKIDNWDCVAPIILDMKGVSLRYMQIQLTEETALHLDKVEIYVQ
jgi:hypothetical protein